MLGGSLRLFTVAGTDVRLHPTFLLLVAWIGVVHGLQGGVRGALWGILFISLLFACVVLHEFGHILAARRYGIRTPDVTLLPIGGVAALERMPEKPSQEIVVALAGPVVNVVIALLLAVVLGARIEPSQIAELQRAQTGDGLLVQLTAANVALALFNLIPAFPMDGGRVLRALLAARLGHTRATRVAARIGQMVAVLLGFWGLFGNPLLVLVAIFVFMAAAGEAGYVEARDVTRGHLAGSAMITRYEQLGPQSCVDDAAQLLLRTTQHEFPVVDGGGRLRGVVTRETIIAALQQGKGRAAVLEIMARDVPTVGETATLEAVFPELVQSTVRFIGVVDAQGRLIGYLTPENISELVLIRSSRPEPEAATGPWSRR